MAVDDRFVDAKGNFMEDVPYLGMAAFEVGQKQGARWPPRRKTRLGLEGHLRGDQHLNELDTGKKRTDGSIKSLEDAGMPKDHILTAALKTLDVPGSMDATNSALVKLPRREKPDHRRHERQHRARRRARHRKRRVCRRQRDRHRHQWHRRHRRIEESQQRLLRLDAAQPAHRGLQHR
jgi:hypothetical protein